MPSKACDQGVKRAQFKRTHWPSVNRELVFLRGCEDIGATSWIAVFVISSPPRGNCKRGLGLSQESKDESEPRGIRAEPFS